MIYQIVLRDSCKKCRCGLLSGCMGFERIKKYLTAEVVFLVVFMISLLFARLIVADRHRIILSEPIGLTSAGLSVRVPAGGGWQSMGSWRDSRIKNSSILVAGLSTGRQQDALVHWRYLREVKITEPQRRLSKKAEQLKAEIVDAGQTEGAGAAMDWIQLRPDGSSEGMFVACLQLGNGEVLELEVVVPEKPLFARRIFEKVSGSVNFEKETYYER